MDIHIIGKALSSGCLYCSGIEDNVEYTFFKCGRWAMRRVCLAADIGMIVIDNILRAMLRGEDVWNRVAHYVEGNLHVKKGDLEHL